MEKASIMHQHNEEDVESKAEQDLPKQMEKTKLGN
jgi:hypothetical protein